MGRLDSADMGRLDSDRVDGLDSDNVDGLDRKYFLLCLAALLTIFVILFIYNITRETDVYQIQRPNRTRPCILNQPSNHIYS